MAQTMASLFIHRQSTRKSDPYDVGNSTERLSKEEGCSPTSNIKKQSLGGDTVSSLQQQFWANLEAATVKNISL